MQATLQGFVRDEYGAKTQHQHIKNAQNDDGRMKQVKMFTMLTILV